MGPQRDLNSADIPLRTVPSSTSSCQSQTIHDQSSLITSPPELRHRNAAPEPQNGATDCSSAAQSASQAIQQAQQQASQSIQQASQDASRQIQQATQQATQSIQQAQQSATNAINQFSNQASQSIAAASRSVSSAVSSASSAIASIQSSAEQAVSRASASMFNAQSSASNAESVLRAAVAAATGSAAAAGSSFLSLAAKATQGAQASVAQIGAAAASKVAEASQQATASQSAAITATEAALAIVGSIIASTLITILIYFLVIRHKKLVRRRSRDQRALRYPDDPKFPDGDQKSPALTNPQTEARRPTINSQTSADEKELRSSVVKTTTVKWNPAKPPKAPTLASWLTLQDGVSPFGPINLPDVTTPIPLGGQLKSPLQSTYSTQPQPSKIPQRSDTNKSTSIEPKLMALKKQPSIAAKATLVAVRPTIAVIAPKTELSYKTQGSQNRESKASIWTDQSVEDDSTPVPQSPRTRSRAQPPASVTKAYNMHLPGPVNNVRNTAEWLNSPSRLAVLGDREESAKANPKPRTSVGLPSNPGQNRGASMTQKSGLPMGLPANFGGTVGKAM